jgi:hypothetical protein
MTQRFCVLYTQAHHGRPGRSTPKAPTKGNKGRQIAKLGEGKEEVDSLKEAKEESCRRCPGLENPFNLVAESIIGRCSIISVNDASLSINDYGGAQADDIEYTHHFLLGVRSPDNITGPLPLPELLPYVQGTPREWC